METCRTYRTYLEKPLQPDNRWSVKAYKLYYKWMCDNGELDACAVYKKLKVPQAKSDLRVPSIEDVKKALVSSEPYRTVYWVMIQSGLRLNEAITLIANIDDVVCVGMDGFHRCLLNLERGKKRSLWAYLIELPGKQHVTRYMVENYAKKHGLVMPKYIRKFVASKMSELDIPDDIIDFYQGRVPRTVLQQSYANKLGKADRWYTVYAEWLKKNLR